MLAYKALDENFQENTFKFELNKRYTDKEILIYKDPEELILKTNLINYPRFFLLEYFNEIKNPEDIFNIYTNNFIILKELKFEELIGIIKINKKNNSNNKKDQFFNENIESSLGICESKNISFCFGVHSSDDVNVSRGVSYCKKISRSNSITNSNNVFSSTSISDSSGIFNSHCVKNSFGVFNSFSIFNCFGVVNSIGMSYSIFSINENIEPKIFNKKVSIERFNEVFSKLKLFNNFLKKIDNENNKMVNMPKDMLDYILSLNEFDSEIFYKITNLKID